MAAQVIQSIFQNRNTIRQTMFHRQSPFSQILTLQRELKLLHHQLSDKVIQIQLKDCKIKELQELVPDTQGQPLAAISTKEERMQCQPECGNAMGEEQLARTLDSIFKEREGTDVGFQLAIEKSEELNILKQNLEERDDFIASLNSQLSAIQGDRAQQDDRLLEQQEELTALREGYAALIKMLSQKQQEEIEAASTQQQLQVLKENNLILQNIIIQKQKEQQLQNAQRDRNLNSRNELVEELTSQKDKMRKIINNYDWKLFCIETEIELVRKEKNMLKEELLKKDYFIADCEVRITELSSRVCSLEEELRLICDENNFFEMQISQKQMKIDELQADVDAYKDIHDFKEMSYQMKEKEDELKEMAKFLREKINENHELKIRTGQLENSLQEAQKQREKIEYERYCLQKRLAENQEALRIQADQIERFEIETAKLLEQLKELGDEQLTFESELNHKSMLINTKDKEIEKIVRKLQHLEISLKGKEKTVQILQNDIKTARTQLKQMKFVNLRYQQELEEIKEIMSVSDEKLKILKREAVDNIENEINYEEELEQVKRIQFILETENQTLMIKDKRLEETFDQMRKEMRTLRIMAKQRVEEMTDYLEHVNRLQSEETTTFEILAEGEVFQVTQSVMQKHKNQLYNKMTHYCNEVEAICCKYE